MRFVCKAPCAAAGKKSGWVPALQDVIETNRSMCGADPSIAFIDNPVAEHKCLCETVEGINATQVLVLSDVIVSLSLSKSLSKRTSVLGR